MKSSVLLIAAVYAVINRACSAPMDTERIVGGETAQKGQFPYIVSLRVMIVEENSSGSKIGVSYSHFCGGSILSEWWTITAAHCTQLPYSPYNVIIVVGAHRYGNDGIRYRLDRFVNHPEYDPELSDNDVALMRARNRIQFSYRVQPIAMRRMHVDGGVAAVISGWGRNEVII